MSFSSSFSSGYNIGSGIKDRHKAKKDLEKHNDFTGKILSDFIIPQLGEEDQEKAAVMMEQLEGDDVSPRGKSQAISTLLSAFGGQIVEEKSRAAKEELKGQLGESNAFMAKIFGEKYGDNPEIMELLNQATSSEDPSVNASNLQGLLGYAQNQDADEVRKGNVGFIKEAFNLDQPVAPYSDPDNYWDQTKKKSGEVGAPGPAGDPGEAGPAGPPIEEFVPDFSLIHEGFKDKAPQAGGFKTDGEAYDYSSAKAAGLSPDKTGHWPSRNPVTGLLLKGTNHPTWDKTLKGEKEAGYHVSKRDGRYYSDAGVANIPRLSEGQMRELVNLARPLFPNTDLNFEKRWSGGNSVTWNEQKKVGRERRTVDDTKNLNAADFLKLPQVSQFLQRNHGARLNEMAAEGEVRNQEILQRQFPGGLPGRPSAPVAQAAQAAQAEQAAVDPVTTGLTAKQQAGMEEALKGYSADPLEEMRANLSPANRTKDLLQSYFKHAGSNASLGGLQSALTMVGTIDEMMHPAGNVGESINETHTEKLALRQNIIDRLAHLSKIARGTKGVATGRINQMIIQMRKGIGLSIGPEATALEQAHHGVANAMLRAMSGAAVTEHEMKRVMEQVGNLHLSDKEYIQRVDAELQAHRDALQTSYNMFAAQGYSIPAQWYQSAAGQGKVNDSYEKLMLLLKAKERLRNAGN